MQFKPQSHFHLSSVISVKAVQLYLDLRQRIQFQIKYILNCQFSTAPLFPPPCDPAVTTPYGDQKNHMKLLIIMAIEQEEKERVRRKRQRERETTSEREGEKAWLMRSFACNNMSSNFHVCNNICESISNEFN